MNATQGRLSTMQDPDPAESDCSDDNHSTVAEADSDDEWQSDAEATEFEEVYDPLMDDTGEAEDGQPQVPFIEAACLHLHYLPVSLERVMASAYNVNHHGN